MVAAGGLEFDGEEVNQEKFVKRRGFVPLERSDVGSFASKDGCRLYKNHNPSVADEGLRRISG
jgi:hypothetical protein